MMNCQDIRVVDTLDEVPGLVLLMEEGKAIWLKDQGFAQVGPTQWTVKAPEGLVSTWQVAYKCMVDSAAKVGSAT